MRWAIRISFAHIDDEDDLELNVYSYDYFGNLTGAAESFGDFSSSVAYTYDQRGLLASITYPNGKTVVYVRDALGRVESVSYEGKTLVEYGYLGDTVISRTLANIEYAAAVDTLGRVTGETFTAISTGTPFMTHSYDYTGHSYRLDERNGIDYTFDGLGKLTAEDSTSYTSDILGNPTNAVDDGLTYGLDNEDRIVDVDDGGGVFAEYG
ncbi:MAG TPA: RHS repeat protein, partial [Anaerohalosphaeraceae bacterium]|nr:RHS repeat protein [Anaerohalosphaeraceae bacterium]